MLRKVRKSFKRRASRLRLKLTPGEWVRDVIIKAGLKTIEE